MEESTSSGFRSFLMVIVAIFVVAQVYAEAAGDRQEGVTLTAGQIDSSTVEVGAFAVVIHGLGERHLVSGAWEQLRTDRGYIVAIDAETLTLGLDRNEWPKMIALGRIQTLVLVGSTSIGGVVERAGRRTKGELTSKAQSLSPRAPDKDSTEVDSGGAGAVRRSAQSQAGPMENRGPRIVKKMAAGMASALVVTTVSGISFALLGDNSVSGEDGDTWDNTYAFIFAGTIVGSSVGFPLGVTWIDPHDSTSKTMFAGIVSGGVAISLAAMTPQEHNLLLPAFLSIYVAPSIISMTVSEISRKPPEGRRFSLGLVPDTKGHLSAVAMLRF